MCAEEDLDCVICATSWKWHTPVCLAANASDKHAVSEVPIVLTVDEAWQLVESYEKTGRWSTLALENRLIDNDGSMFMAVLHMMRQGVLGDLIHAECGYVHDLREVKFPGGDEPWRLQHSIDRNGNLYPDHPLNRAMAAMDVNHGDRFDHLVSMSARSGVLNEYAAATLGKDHPLATQPMALGDSNVTLIRTVGGQDDHPALRHQRAPPARVPPVPGHEGGLLLEPGHGAAEDLPRRCQPREPPVGVRGAVPGEAPAPARGGLRPAASVRRYGDTAAGA